MYRVVTILVGWFLGLFNKVKVFDKEKLPAEDGYIIACTHTGWIDMLNLGIAVHPRPIHFMAKKQLFDHKALGWFITKMNAFPVDRDNPGPSVIKVPRQLIKNNEIVGIFPSGTRNSEGSSLKQGAITIAQLSKAPIIPAAYIGPNTPKDVFARTKGAIIFGDPIYVDAKGKEGREEYTQLLEQRMIELEQQLQQEMNNK
ncbi:1-acyl-sn-glycerol-3-phosphate acyltransferase [Kurthia zopfii]|uniref:1-acyl-sn-glycerol-3-phosphate acyltransferase n=1 Tax=Kurthia zopfii TaxID=1650 RepID=A0A2U3AFE5_9BACL|nr:1-acyl-sn-glycerol-3-phosphate acyltransferase [Kurthia zopfii]PWI23263.1 1-acyl-sn-glycerol-3-phosphate acyltransferase [Kurthia zopfii]TDR42121.1 1-acyl-sn-glycerol-3-phosphate acyltransferase [Kurthia zopfii]STX10960.1 1-acyl-sn-glycerol-3-phosphate acyltransferase [Kurthia zopfii]VEI05666.1 1-acyl-sn-glycerol-3-phosphate acyltransferase [Kurthia zopfii]GEK29940.1 1-acyl-sn-glycerol-3-phosphate acyltransferase [Kurthia zopfii]